MRTLGEVVDNQSANCFKSVYLPNPWPPGTGLERRPADQRASLNRVAMLIGFRQLRLIRRRVHRALGESADSRAEITAVAQRIHFYAEHRAHRERRRRNALLGHR